MMVNLLLATKSLHLVAIISWMAGLLYLPRLFVYHSSENLLKEQSEVFKIMELRLFKYIMTPSMILALGTGTVLLILPSSPIFSGENWIYVKLFFVLLMVIHHFFQWSWLKSFALGENRHGQKFYRLQNEVPTVIMILIIIFVVFKPF